MAIDDERAPGAVTVALAAGATDDDGDNDVDLLVTDAPIIGFARVKWAEPELAAARDSQVHAVDAVVVAPLARDADALPPVRRTARPSGRVAERGAHRPRGRGAALPADPAHQSEIAAELFMSVNTVKTHVKSIYAKVGASSRSDAVGNARVLGLLPM